MLDYLAEVLSFGMLLFLWLQVIKVYPDLPTIVPTHFNINGLPDDYGSKHSIIALPLVVTILVVAISVLSRFPHIFNYPVKITPENAERQYTIALQMLRILKLMLVVVFTFLTHHTIEVALAKRTHLSKWFLPLAVILVLFPIVFYIVKSLRKR